MTQISPSLMSAIPSVHRARAQIVKALALAAFAAPLPAYAQVPNAAPNAQSRIVMKPSDLVNSPPVAVIDYVDLAHAAKAFNVLANDEDANNDALTIINASARHGAVAFTADGLVAYVANQTEPRSDEIIYVLADSRGGVAKGKVIVVAK